MQRDGLARAPERVQAAAVFRDVGIADIDHRVEQRHGLRQNRRHVLPAFGRQFAQPRVGAGIDLEPTADDVHEVRVISAEGFVEAGPGWENGGLRFANPPDGLSPAPAFI